MLSLVISKIESRRPTVRSVFASARSGSRATDDGDKGSAGCLKLGIDARVVCAEPAPDAETIIRRSNVETTYLLR